MGALNVSPESFYAGSIHARDEALIRAALAMAEAGAALIDVGARSTAPYRVTDVGETEEADRLGHAVELLVAKLPVPVSADTSRAGPASAALDAGARIINDVSGLRDPRVAALVAERGASVMLTASPMASGLGAPSRAALVPDAAPVAVVRRLLEDALARARRAGIPEDRIVLDPGVGFFRGEAVPWDRWDVEVLGRLDALGALGRPLAVGVSRKSFIGAITGRAAPDDRLAGSLAATAIAVLRGAAVIRTHDVPESVDAVRVAERLREAAGA